MKFKKISFDSQSSTSTCNTTCTQLAPKEVTSSTFNINRFRKTLSENKSKAGWLTYFAKKKDAQEDEIPVLHNILFMYHNNVDVQNPKVQNEMCKYFESLSVSNAECARIEKLTRGQNKSQNWFECRKGRLTSSNFGTICKLKPETDPKNVLKTLLYDVSFTTNKYVKWGIDHEPAARRSYCRLYPLYMVSQSGLIVNPTFPHLGCSPDGIVTLENGESGLLEIKCPASDKWRTHSPAECGLDSDFCCSLDENQNLKLKINHNYYFQVQGQMAICNKKWCDFVIWTLKPPLSVERIYFDESFWLKCLSKLNSFYVKSMLPELFTQRLLRSLK
jgi:putative phage-type endonuclease